MARRLLALPAALLALSLLAACGDDTKADDGADDTSEQPSSTESAQQASPPPDREPTGVMCDYPADPNGAVKANEPPPADAVVSGQLAATMETTVGTFHATLDADRAPCTVNSFVSLADQNYFNATDCHRLTTSGIFVLQCGDPTATGTGGPGYTIPDEVDGSETYGPGTLAMAKTSMPDSGGSQFFIVYAESPLPPDYTVFGSVDEATVTLLEGVAKAGSTPEFDGRPNTDVELQSVTVE